MQHDAEPQASHGREQVVNMVRNHGNAPSQRCDREAFYLVWRVGGITRKLLVHDRVACQASVSVAGVFVCKLTAEAAISGDLLSAVISIRYILGFRKDNPNVFKVLVQNLP